VTTKFHGGAQVEKFPLNVPGFLGLNKQSRTSVLGPEWATLLENTVLDRDNRVAARKGWQSLTDTPAGASIVQMIEYINSAGDPEIIASLSDDTLVRSSNNGSTWTDITDSATVVDPNMQLVEFRGVVVGFQDGADPVVYDGTVFADLSSTGVPKGNVALSAFGRLWAKDTPTVIKYSALLDETDWDSSDAGEIDLTSVWPSQDEIMALAEFNNRLVVFGRRNIVMFDDEQGSVLGLDPTAARVVDIVRGLGCIARDSVVAVQGDLWFLDPTGVQSLGRLVVQRSNPTQNVSFNVQDELLGFVASVPNQQQIRAVYSPRDSIYLLSLSLGSGSIESGVAFAFDTRGAMEDGSHRCVGIWNTLVPSAVILQENLDLLIALKTKVGEVGRYAGHLDDGETYLMQYESGWNNLGVPNQKLLKKVNAILFVQGNASVVYRWAFDFEESFRGQTKTFEAAGMTAQWGVDEWGEGEWGGGVSVRNESVGGAGSGEYIKIGLTVTINGSQVSLQEMGIYAKIGRVR
jgi:hypothetical protein